jgi:hypothetical protein
MPLYDYESKSGERIEKFFHMSDKKPEEITENGIKYTRVFSVPNAITDSKKSKTIGDLAYKNREKFIKEGKFKPKEKKDPWWRKGKKVDKDLAKMTKKQKQKYIFEGKK